MLYKELEELEELFENEDVVVTKAVFSVGDFYTISTFDVGIKDETGDIIRYVTINSETKLIESDNNNYKYYQI